MTTSTQEQPVVESSEERLGTLAVATRSDIGMRREENQDSFGIVEGEAYKFLIVADGMGGVRGGALASSTAVETVKAFLSDIPSPTIEDLRRAVQQANAEIFAKGAADQSLAGMGTTFVALFFSGKSLAILNVGDSRAYRVRADQIDRLTEDHTLVMELLRSGTIDAEQAQNHPVSHMLTRSLGPAEEVEVDCFACTEGPYRGEIFFLCSDGLYNLVKDHEILAFLQENTLETAVEKLVDLANQRGGTDNITVIAVEVGEGYQDIPPHLLEGGEEESPTPVTAVANATTSGEDKAADSKPAVEAADDAQSKAETNGAHHMNGKGTEEVKSTINISSLRSSYAENLSAGKAASATQKIEKQKEREQPKTAKPPPIGAEQVTEEKMGIFSSAFSAVLCLIGAGVGGAMLGIVFSTPEVQDTGVTRKVGDVTISRQAPPRISSVREAGTYASSDTRVARNPSPKVFENSSMDPLTFSPQQAISAVERMERSLTGRREQIKAKLAAFEAPIGGSFGKTLSESAKTREELEQRYAELRTETDSANRRLSVWVLRRKRLETSEPINLVAEVALSSNEVKEKNRAFGEATWQYLKEVERLEYSPNDPALASRVVELMRLRTQRMEELFVTLRSAIDSSILDAQQSVAELSMELDRVKAELASTQETVAFVKLLTSGDKAAKEAKRIELEKELAVVEAELSELVRLKENLPRGLPDSALEHSRR